MRHRGYRRARCPARSALPRPPPTTLTCGTSGCPGTASSGCRTSARPASAAGGRRGCWNRSGSRRHAEDFDVFHVQFGFDGRHPEELRELVALLAERGKPLVYTVHDLRNPNHPEPGLHEEQMAVILEAADALVTLTDCAAARIEERFGRDAEVIPHPHIVPFDLLEGRYAEPRRTGRPPVVGVHLKSMRPNMVGVPLLRALTEGGGIGDARLRVDIHTEIWDPQAPAFRGDLRMTLEYLDKRGAVDLRVHDYFSDVELYDYLAGLDVAILPYRFGTHSGWLEACRDLGTAVVAPSCGCYTAQGDAFEFHCDEDGLDAGELARRRSSGLRGGGRGGPFSHELRGGSFRVPLVRRNGPLAPTPTGRDCDGSSGSLSAGAGGSESDGALA